MKVWMLAMAIAAGCASAAGAADCVNGAGDVGAIVCGDPELAALDREASRLSTIAEGEGAEHDWLADRDDCITAHDPKLCLRDAYLERIVDLRGNSSKAAADKDGISIGPLGVQCEGLPEMHVTFVNPPQALAYLATGSDPLVMVQGRSADGARYVAQNDGGEWVFWNKGDAATFSRPGKPDSQCKIGG